MTAKKVKTRKPVPVAAPRTGRITRQDQAYAAALREYAIREQAAADAQAGATPPADNPVTDPTHFAACPARHVPGEVCCCEYERRVQAIEDEGATRSDAQGAVDAEIAREKQGLPPVDGSPNPQGSPVDESRNPQAGPAAGTQLALVRQAFAAVVAKPVAPADGFAVPIRFLQAALISSGNGDIRYYLNGVYLHAVDGELRIVATDGHRMLVSRYAPDCAMPAWAEKGILLPRSELVAALPLLDKNATFDGRHAPQGTAYIECVTEGEAQIATLRATNGFCAFRLRVLDGKFPDYQRVLSENSGVVAGGERGVMETSAFNTKYLRGATDIAQKLGATAIHAFLGKAQDAGLFTFMGAPDTVLIIMPMRGDDPVSASAVKLLGSGAVNASVAALRAHMTRTVKALESADTKIERDQLEARRLGFEARIAGLLGLLAQLADAPKRLENRASA